MKKTTRIAVLVAAILGIIVLTFQTKTAAQEAAEPPIRLVLAEVTAYTASPDETDDTPTITASGTTISAQTAACPAHYKFGTVLQVEDTQYVCEDRMAKKYRHGEYFDIHLQTKSQAFDWGRKTITIAIYE